MAKTVIPVVGRSGKTLYFKSVNGIILNPFQPAKSPRDSHRDRETETESLESEIFSDMPQAVLSIESMAMEGPCQPPLPTSARLIDNDMRQEAATALLLMKYQGGAAPSPAPAPAPAPYPLSPALAPSHSKQKATKRTTKGSKAPKAKKRRVV